MCCCSCRHATILSVHRCIAWRRTIRLDHVFCGTNCVAHLGIVFGALQKIDCVSGLSHTLHKSRILSSCVTPLVFSHRLRCVNCQDSRLQVRDSRFLSLCLWVTCGLQFESPPVSQRQEPPCLDSVGSPRNSAWLRAHGQSQSNRHTAHQQNAPCQCCREQLGVPT